MIYESNNELMHYGVPGMRWGVHAGHATKAYDKAVKKRDSLLNKAKKRELKMDKTASKYHFTSIGQGKEERAVKRYRHSIAKANVWMKKMDKEFSSTKLQKAEQKYSKLGEKYLDKNPIKSQKMFDKALDIRELNERLHHNKIEKGN